MLHQRQQQHKIHWTWTGIIRDWSLQIALWLVWTLTVASTACISWHHDYITNQPVNILGMVIHCALTGIIGMIVITYIEMRLQPWRFFHK